MSTFRPFIQVKNLNSSSRKCGDITYCIQVGKRVYALNCLYCSQICLEWDIFINHIELEHADKLDYDSMLNVENRDIGLQENLMDNEGCIRKAQQSINNSIINKFDESESLSYNDPLEDENSMNSTSLEDSMKIDNMEILPNDLKVNSNMENLPDSLQNTEIDNNCDKMNFITPEFATKREIQEIKEKIEANKKLIQRLSENVKLLQNNRVKIPTNQLIILPKTPYDDKDEFLKFEKKIKESEENFRKLVDELKETINGHPTKFIRNCWRTIIKDEAAKEFCWQGSKDKIGIKHFSTMLAIKSAYNLKFADSNDTEFEKIISERNDVILSDDISIQSISTCNDDNNENNKNCVYDKRKFTELIIKYYREYPILWQTNRREYKNISKQQEAFKMITKLVNKETNMNLKCVQIKGKINKLRSKFREEHEYLAELSYSKEGNDMDYDDVTINSNEFKNVSWLYEKMSFLKDYICDRKKRGKRGTKALSNDKDYLPLAKLCYEENQQFIELYKMYPCLWNINHIGFRFKDQRQKSLRELLQAVNAKFNLKLSLDDLQKQLYCLRYAVTQEKHRQIECEKLNIEFIPHCKLFNELLFLNESVGPFKCEYCAKIFNGPDQYKVHKSSHDGSMPYTCPQCNKGFMKIGNCTVHLRRHNKDFQFECQECGKKFPTSTDLNVHKRHHTGEKPYFCDSCGQSFRTWTYFDSHRRRHDKNPNHICSICSKGFYEHNKLKQHMKSHTNVRDKVCSECGKSFSCTKYLNQHKLTHAEIKKYSCKICGKKFAQHGGLSNHIKSHVAIGNEGIESDANLKVINCISK